MSRQRIVLLVVTGIITALICVCGFAGIVLTLGAASAIGPQDANPVGWQPTVPLANAPNMLSMALYMGYTGPAVKLLAIIGIILLTVAHFRDVKTRLGKLFLLVGGIPFLVGTFLWLFAHNNAVLQGMHPVVPVIFAYGFAAVLLFFVKRAMMSSGYEVGGELTAPVTLLMLLALIVDVLGWAVVSGAWDSSIVPWLSATATVWTSPVTAADPTWRAVLKAMLIPGLGAFPYWVPFYSGLLTFGLRFVPWTMDSGRSFGGLLGGVFAGVFIYALVACGLGLVLGGDWFAGFRLHVGGAETALVQSMNMSPTNVAWNAHTSGNIPAGKLAAEPWVVVYCGPSERNPVEVYVSHGTTGITRIGDMRPGEVQITPDVGSYVGHTMRVADRHRDLVLYEVAQGFPSELRAMNGNAGPCNQFPGSNAAVNAVLDCMASNGPRSPGVEQSCGLTPIMMRR